MKYVLLLIAALFALPALGQVTAEDVAKARALQERRDERPQVDNTLPGERDTLRRKQIRDMTPEEYARWRAAKRIRE